MIHAENIIIKSIPERRKYLDDDMSLASLWDKLPTGFRCRIAREAGYSAKIGYTQYIFLSEKEKNALKDVMVYYMTGCFDY